MKKILLSLLLIGALNSSFAQLAINEVYVEPNCGTMGTDATDYIELYNGTGDIVNLDCYRIAVVYKEKPPVGTNTYLYVFDLPHREIAPNGLFVFSGLSTFCVQGGSRTPNPDSSYNWNSITAATTDASLKRYILNADCDAITAGNQPCWQLNQTYVGNTNLYDLLAKSNTDAVYNIFLFNAGAGSDIPVNSLLFGYGLTTPPADITTLPALTAAHLGTCGGNDIINFTQIVSNEQVTSASGSDNGYFREFNGVCGTWKKAAASTDHTPGTSNGGSAPAGSGSFKIALNGQPSCGGNTYSATVNVSDIASVTPYPITYYVIEDEFPFTETRGSEDDEQVQTGTYSNANGLNQFTVSGLTSTVGYFIVAVNAAGCFSATIRVEASCIVTPVKFKSFTATRSNASSVAISWTTASEQNNKGFNVQKNVNGEWKTIAFVFSQAPNGNSTSALSYSFNDMNNEKGITQYRIQQVDLDSRFAYSDIRAIRGEGALGKIVIYPNPSTDGKVNVVFEDNSALRDVLVNDMQGRIVQSFKGISNNILVIERLTSGFYTIKITNRTTAASSVQKVVVK